MGVRDALLLNTTGSNFEALQSNETARIKGDFSIKNTSDTEVFGVDVSAAEVNITANITSSGDISGSETSTGSFGRVVASTFLGDGIEIRDSLTRSSGLVTASAQIASDISGAFDKGFFFGFQASSSISGGLGITGSFGRLEGVVFNGDGSNIKSTLPRSTGILTSSAQIAADISGSFNKGFEFEGTIKTSTGGVFSTGASLGRTVRFLGGLGSPSSALAIGGQAVNTPQTLTEEYDGSSWSEGGELPAAHSGMGTAGTQNAGFIAGGFPDGTVGDKALDYNGSSWSETTDLPATNINHTIGAGASANAAFIGITPSFSPTDCRTGDWYSWNGSNWTEESGHLNNGRYNSNGGGESTEAALVTGGDPQSLSDCSELWNGSSWSNTSALITGNRYGTFAGTTSDAIVIGGYPNVHLENTAQIWDGTTWTETSRLISGAAYGGGGHGAAASGRVGIGTLAGGAHKFGGGVFSTPASELFTAFVGSASFHNIEATTLTGDGSSLSASLQAQLLTSVTQISNSISGSFNKGFDLQGGVSASLGLYGGTWSEVNPLNQARAGGAVGNKAAALASAGRPPGGAPYASTCTELWNGVNWSVATARSNVGGGTSIAGNSEAAVSHQVPTTANHTEIWNGASWSEGSTANAHLLGGSDMVGTVDAAIEAGGFNGSSQVQSDAAEWNGSTWSEATALPAARGGGSFAGIQNDAMYSGGSLSTGIVTSTVLYNGTNWSAGVPLPILSYRQAGDGSANSSIHAGAHPASPGAWPQYNAYEFNGLSWYRVADMTRAPANSYDMDIAGDPKGALAVGGYVVNNTEEFSSYGNDSSGSFGQLRGTVGGEIKTNMFNVSGSTMKLPMFSDADINYWNKEPQESTGSISGSVVRTGDVNILNKPGSFFFHTDHNALAFTYVSSSVYSQSLDFVTCQYHSASIYTSSAGFITQSHYCYHNVIQYITGSYT